MSALSAPIEVFYSYADADEDLRIELDKHLSLLQRQGIITTWHKRSITLGIDWKKALDQEMERGARFVLSGRTEQQGTGPPRLTSAGHRATGRR